ncbi:SDR family oxidoreductase [Sphingomonas crocodyli]|uniref:SDR family oxidoreductase n=1 Tax=Sphingomonas crocodyli TaxID=1979270 RepID=A0A437LVG7_9SPHN|nr:SDR family oxidoreductase [Sphingomonas crocodyli]RVT89358.1 SDR family oxidoreductase [Sphingomonas crocodyli]
MGNPVRRKAVVTGASGGMGRALARRFGATMDLVLTDVAADKLRMLTEELRGEGYTVAASLPGDLAEDTLLAELVAGLGGEGGLGALLHAAGLSPQLADWDRIIRVNLVATEKLLRAIEPALAPGSVTVLIASVAGHLMGPNIEIDTLLSDPVDPALIDRLRPKIAAPGTSDFGASAMAYGVSKRRVIDMAERRAGRWAAKGARIVSISPGLIHTPMGLREVQDPSAAGMLAMTPAGRWGTVADIAEAAWFLCSEGASFITGCDLRVDGGVIGAIRTSIDPAMRPMLAKAE